MQRFQWSHASNFDKVLVNHFKDESIKVRLKLAGLIDCWVELRLWLWLFGIYLELIFLCVEADFD